MTQVIPRVSEETKAIYRWLISDADIREYLRGCVRSWMGTMEKYPSKQDVAFEAIEEEIEHFIKNEPHGFSQEFLSQVNAGDLAEILFEEVWKGKLNRASVEASGNSTKISQFTRMGGVMNSVQMVVDCHGDELFAIERKVVNG